MAKKKRYRGQYCKVCNNIVSNERFSGKGHSNHICKKCSKMSLEERNEQVNLNKIYRLYRYSNLSKVNKLMLQNYLKSGSEKVRLAAKEILDEFIETARLIRLDEEKCEEIMGIDLGHDAYLDDDEDDDHLGDLHSIDGYLDFIPVEDDELPF